jgi:HEPN superfamily AbiU2-like protein
MSDTTDRLDDLLTNGICNDIYRAEQALGMFIMIGQHAGPINAATFGEFYGSIQQVLWREAVLSVASLFERPDNRFPNRGIPSVLNLLETNAATLAIPERRKLIQHVTQFAEAENELAALSDMDLTARTVRFFRQRLLENPAVRIALDKVKTFRDKAVAHNEQIAFEVLPQPTIAQFSGLLTHAQQFLKAIGQGYLGVHYGQSCDDDYIMSRDAEKAAICLSRVLVASGVIDSETAKKARMTLHKD